MNRASLEAGYFESLYARDPDPWRFATSAYEAAKYEATLAALSRPRYRRALEIGCSIGVLTERLAGRCDALLAVDAAANALEAARRRLTHLPHVELAQLGVPASWPDGRFDLILLSEVVYYLDREDVRRLAERVAGSLDPGGEVLLVHWLGATDYPLSGDEAAEAFIAARADALGLICQQRTEHYRLDLLLAR